MALVAVYPTNVALIEKANASVDMDRCKGELKRMFTSVCMCPLYTCKDACKYLPIYISQSLYLHAALSQRGIQATAQGILCMCVCTCMYKYVWACEYRSNIQTVHGICYMMVMSTHIQAHF